MAASNDLDAFLADIGPRWSQQVATNVRCVIERYDPLLAAVPRQGVTVTRDIAYGPDPRQQLDIFAKPGGTRRPIVLFMHGGAFVEGERNRSDQVYANVLHYFARHDLVGINTEYRLAPRHPFPCATQDVALALEWAIERAGAFGGDPDNIFLMGHSAGAAHVASLAYDPLFACAAHRHVAGSIIVSGRVRADNSVENPNARKVEAYYGSDAARYDELSPISHVRADSMPTFIAFAEFENPLIDLYCLELAYKLACAKRHAPALMRLPRHNHTSIIAHINTQEDRLGSAMRAFIAEHRRAA